MSESETQAPAPTQPTPARPKKKYDPITLPNFEQIFMQDIFDNCFVKATMSAAMGGLAGAAFGIFSASLDNAGHGFEPVPLENDKPTRVVIKEMLLNMKNKSWSFAKGFAVMGAIYSFNECCIEKERGKHDKFNATLAGCATGGMLAYAGGPKAVGMGCASFAAFSTAIEYFMDH
mmetsp:Transcript_13303/g.23557  ORF Transcript_13303/g.23557 Transcript_13303/m.23557 type:complete len:175 (-) Transcript_13303:509-1033(-)|eukprot:CAMPEP_0175066636 /NCGR_PEP_ID=MMETSP0052_2-20121109/16629_1 /TAXON_ID=51329 ORGANISM="Polytomella parva, Strain SAG 63-3" /NCGR_SAMPLE_ID=MMETSP0052_2 /ASSEMBLY_ACC=CAM_ASM_000194 /LENGTH=174 /DNA_ID=CAMNT_0016333381 /DNA_START=38 /DNA_END=562 /DNA_ORIENTATION=-